MPWEAQPTWARLCEEHAHPTHARRESMAPSRCLRSLLNATLVPRLMQPPRPHRTTPDRKRRLMNVTRWPVSVRMLIVFVAIGWPILVLASGVLIALPLRLGCFCLIAAIAYSLLAWRRRRNLRVLVLAGGVWMVLWPLVVSLTFDPISSFVDRAERPHREEMAALEELGAEARYVYSRRYWLVVARDPGFDDAALRSAVPYLKKLPVRVLLLRRTRVTEQGIGELKGVATLEHLCLDDTAVGDAVLDALAAIPNLGVVSLERTRVTDDALKRAAGRSELWGGRSELLWGRVQVHY